MPSPNASDKARAHIKALEADPKHSGKNPKAEEETRSGNLSDPAHQQAHSIHPDHHQDSAGGWHGPGLDDFDEVVK